MCLIEFLGDTWIQITSSNLAFTKMFFLLLDDCMKLKTTELLHTIDETLYEVFDAQIKHNETYLRGEMNQEVSFIKIGLTNFLQIFV